MGLQPPDQQPISEAIAREESRLLRLQEELVEAQARLASLKIAMASQGNSKETSSTAQFPPSALTTDEKVALFRSRFRGRDDIYPRFWTNVRTGRKGYAPACGNEWVRECARSPE